MYANFTVYYTDISSSQASVAQAAFLTEVQYTDMHCCTLSKQKLHIIIEWQSQSMLTQQCIKTLLVAVALCYT